MSIVVTGATGPLGHLVVTQLLERGVPAEQVVAGGRATEKLADLADRGVRTTRIDYADDATLDAAIGSGDTVLLVSGNEVGQRITQHQAVVDAAVRAGAARIVYTSAPRADDTTLILAPEHAATEAAITASGLPFTILRNNWYTENYGQQLAQARETGVLLSSAGDGRVASASRVDFADAAAVVLSTEGHEGRVYELGGDVAWTFADLAAAMGEVLGREVSLQSVTGAEHLEILTGAGLDEGTAGFVVGLDQNIAEGTLGEVTGDLAELTGRPTTPLVGGLRTLA